VPKGGLPGDKLPSLNSIRQDVQDNLFPGVSKVFPKLIVMSYLRRARSEPVRLSTEDAMSTQCRECKTAIANVHLLKASKKAEWEI
jgi:hypothetical protein